MCKGYFLFFYSTETLNNFVCYHLQNGLYHRKYLNQTSKMSLCYLCLLLILPFLLFVLFVLFFFIVVFANVTTFLSFSIFKDYNEMPLFSFVML